MSILSKDTILDKMKEDNVEFINLQFSDMIGKVKSVTIPEHKFSDALEIGLWFDGSSIEGFTRIFESDMLLIPDIDTYAIIPWVSTDGSKVARFICDVNTPEGEPYQSDPRVILKNVLEEAWDMGYVYNTGPECEFFLFKKTNGDLIDSSNHKIQPHDRGQYFDLVLDEGYEVRREMMLALEQMGLEVESSHHEVAPGQHEISFRYGNALQTADRVMTLKAALKAVAQRHGLHATFMPKPITGVNGNGMHVHQSLFTKNGENAFYNPDDEYKFSETAYQFLAGQMHHIKAMCGILNPLINSYKRLVPGYEASTYICWAQRNRSALIRVPRYTVGKEKSIRMEIRCPDPSTNPYLAFAVLLKAGLDGIKNKMQPPKPVEEDVFEFSEATLEARNIDYLPGNLWESMRHLRDNPVISSVLGDEMLRKYLHAKRSEWDDYRVQVTEWELDRYLETV